MLKSLFVKIHSFVIHKFGKWFFSWIVLTFFLSFYYLSGNITDWITAVFTFFWGGYTLFALFCYVVPVTSEKSISYLMLGLIFFLPITMDIKRYISEAVYAKYRIYLIPIIIKYILFFYALTNTVLSVYLIYNRDKCGCCLSGLL